MSKITKNERISTLERQVAALITLVKMKGYNESEPQLKQLDQSVFDGLDEKWRFAAVDGCTSRAYVYEQKPHIMHIKRQYWRIDDGLQHIVGDNYDASNWQDSLIEREMKELTGSALAKDYFKRGHCPRVCFVGEDDDECLSDLMVAMVIGYVEGKGFETSYNEFSPCAAMVNSYGDELEASEVGA